MITVKTILTTIQKINSYLQKLSQTFCKGWRDSSVDKVLSMQAQESDFDSQNPNEYLDIVVYVYNPSAWRMERGGTLKLASQPT